MPNFSSQCDMGTEDVPDVDAIEADVADISHARLKLDDLLNEIVDKNEDCFSTDDENNRQSGVSTSTSTATKRLYTHKTPRKKKKKDLTVEVGDTQKASYIIKLFDREIDLAKFEANTSLYGMVREWMRNKPRANAEESADAQQALDNNIAHSEGEIQTETDENSAHFIYELPKPIKTEDTCPYPRPLPPALKTALIEDIINTESNIEDLRRDNMHRWRKVKNRWKEHSFRQQRRYVDSLVILKDMFTAQTSKLV